MPGDAVSFTLKQKNILNPNWSQNQISEDEKELTAITRFHYTECNRIKPANLQRLYSYQGGGEI
jgi:hypothetical protein